VGVKGGGEDVFFGGWGFWTRGEGGTNESSLLKERRKKRDSIFSASAKGQTEPIMRCDKKEDASNETGQRCGGETVPLRVRKLFPRGVKKEEGDIPSL